MLAIAISVHLHRQLGHLRQGVAASLDHHLRVVHVQGEVLREKRVAHQMNDVLFKVLAVVQAQMVRGCGIAPLNAAFRVQQDHAIGRSLNGL